MLNVRDCLLLAVYMHLFFQQLIEDYAKSTLQVCEAPTDLELMDKMPASSYGFPCGFRRDFHSERSIIPEALFDLSRLTGHENARDTLMDVSTIAQTAAGMCDADIKQARCPHSYYSLNMRPV